MTIDSQPIPIPHFTRSEESPGFLIWQLSNLWQKQICAALEPHNLTHAQYILLAAAYWLSRNGKAHTQIQIARMAQTDIMMTSKVLRALEEKNYISRPSNPDDTRERMVQLTPLGVGALSHAQQTVQKFDKEFFSAIYMARHGFSGYVKEIIRDNEEAAKKIS
jgi:DNA-binding MarR family transcriptional regulator